MKAICIRNEDETGFNSYLKIGKIYEIEMWRDTGGCSVTDDCGRMHHYLWKISEIPSDIFLEHFKPLDEYRHEQIDQILE